MREQQSNTTVHQPAIKVRNVLGINCSDLRGAATALDNSPSVAVVIDVDGVVWNRTESRKGMFGKKKVSWFNECQIMDSKSLAFNNRSLVMEF